MDRVATTTHPLDVLCVEIVERSHAALHRDLAILRVELAALCTKVDSHALRRVRTAADKFSEQVESHLAKEEHLLFPAIETLAAASREGRRRPPLPFVALVHPIKTMEGEHLRIEAAMEVLLDLARQVTGPDGPSVAWQLCLELLKRLQRDLHEHHRDETDFLFPRALELEHQLPV